jgi:alpha-maltose-1-phosphate synthase
MYSFFVKHLGGSMDPCLRVLIVSEHATNRYGGEAMLPYNYYKFLQKIIPDVYLITHERVRKHLEQDFSIVHENIIYVPDTSLHKFLHKMSSKLPSRIAMVTTGVISHFLTQLYQWFLVKKIVKEEKICVVHEPAPVSPKQPSMMFGLGVPVVIGPMNGGMEFPLGFKDMSGSVEGILYSFLRVVSSITNLLIPGKFFAAVLLVANQRTKSALPRFTTGTVKEFVENGVYAKDVLRYYPNRDEKVCKVIFVGRLIELKAVDILIEAVQRIDSLMIHLSIVGEGPQRKRLEDFAKKVPSNVSVEFHGHVDHSGIMKYYDESDIFVLPSLRECGGAVVLEAMARGLPVIATKWGGPVDYVSPETGFLIEPHCRSYMVGEIAHHIMRLASDVNLRKRMGEAGRKRIIDHFLWEEKVLTITEIYRNLLKVN